MAKATIPKYSSVKWAALAVGAVIIGYLLGISSITWSNLSNGETYMMLIYTEVTYEDIETWSESSGDVTITGSGVFPISGSEVTGDNPRAFILFSAPSKVIAEEVANTFPGFNGKSRLRVIKKQD